MELVHILELSRGVTRFNQISHMVLKCLLIFITICVDTFDYNGVPACVLLQMVNSLLSEVGDSFVDDEIRMVTHLIVFQLYDPFVHLFNLL